MNAASRIESEGAVKPSGAALEADRGQYSGSPRRARQALRPSRHDRAGRGSGASRRRSAAGRDAPTSASGSAAAVAPRPQWGRSSASRDRSRPNRPRRAAPGQARSWSTSGNRRRAAPPRRDGVRTRRAPPRRSQRGRWAARDGSGRRHSRPDSARRHSAWDDRPVSDRLEVPMPVKLHRCQNMWAKLGGPRAGKCRRHSTTRGSSTRS